MPKRKRDEPPSDSSSAPLDPSLSIDLKHRKKLCAQRLAAAQKPLLSALRHAVLLERQKFSRRKKGAKSSNDDKATLRLEAEYAKLKALDLAKVAEQHVRKVIAKVKSLRESDAIPESAKVVEKAEQDVALSNVKGRLFKVEGVRRIVDEVIEDLRIIAGAGAGIDAGGSAREEKGGGEKRRKVKRAVEEEGKEPDAGMQNFDSDALAVFDARIAAPSSADEDSDDSLAEGQRPPSIGDAESAEEKGYLLEELAPDGEAKHQSAPSHDSGNEEDKDSSSDPGALRNSDIDVDSGSDSDSDSASIPVPKPKTKAKAALLVYPSNSTFLPALSNAAYFSGSESEASDLDGDLAPRKNRRGQRARQKIWEKKYKDKAIHKQNEDRRKGWDAKKGAVGDDRRGAKPRGFGPEKSGENAIPLGGKKTVTKRDDVGDLHPSWLAAKAAKEKKSAFKIAESGQGGSKKIVFD